MQDNTQHPFIEKIKEHKEKVLLLGAVVVVVLLALLAPRIQESLRQSREEPTITEDEALPEGCKPGYNFSETTGKPCPATIEDVSDVSEKQRTVVSSAANTTGYEDAIASYKGKLIAFGAACSAAPADLLVAAGTRIMVANNSDQVQTIMLGDRTAVLRPYHYFTQALPTSGSYSAACNGVQAATITVT